MQKYMGDFLQLDELNCNICQEPFGGYATSPRVLSCGHTFCTNCLKKLIKDRPYCPDCRLPIDVDDVSALPVLYILKQIIESINDFNFRNLENGSCYLSEDCNLFESHSVVLLNKENIKFPSLGTCPLHVAPQQFWCKGCSLWICGSCAYLSHSGYAKESECQVILASKQFKNMKNEQLNRISDQIKELDNALSSIQNLTKLVMQECEISKNGQSNNNFDDESLIKYKDILSSLAKKKMELEATLELVVDAKDKFNVKSLKQFHKALKYLDSLWASKKFPQVENDILNGIYGNILEKVPFVLTSKPTCVACVVKRDGKSWFSPVKFENNEMIIPTLKESCPVGSHCFPLQEVRRFSKDVRVFMKLGRQGIKLGTLEVSLFDTRHAEQFSILATGEKGPSYRWTKFFASEGLFTRYLAGGDYEKNNGEGGAKVLENLDSPSGQLMRMEEGFVCGEESYQSSGIQAQFRIFYKVGGSPFARCPIGKVVQGLDFLPDIAKTNFDKIYIEECGIIVPLAKL